MKHYVVSWECMKCGCFGSLVSETDNHYFIGRMALEAHGRSGANCHVDPASFKIECEENICLRLEEASDEEFMRRLEHVVSCEQCLDTINRARRMSAASEIERDTGGESGHA